MDKFNITYKGWSDEASPIKSDVKVKTSHAKLVANNAIAERNKDAKFREKVSKGVKKFYGDSKKRFLNYITKQEDGCWICSKRTIMEDKVEYQAKEYSAKIFNLNFDKECITQKCGNPKCVNPKHLLSISREDTAILTVAKRKKIVRGDGHPSKLSVSDVKDIIKKYNRFLKERNGKHRGIASLIHKDYPNVTLSAICQIIKNNLEI
jgi:hypothetical protein